MATKEISAALRLCSSVLDKRWSRFLLIFLFVCILYASMTAALPAPFSARIGNPVPQDTKVHHGMHDSTGDATNPKEGGAVSPPQSQPPQSQPQPDCRPYAGYSTRKHEPFSSGAYKLSFQRPMPSNCRKFVSPEVDDTVKRFKNVISDPDLYRLFENSFPNTLDTAVKFKGYAKDGEKTTDEELTFIITGDINAMWLRDSSNQMQSYLPLLKADSGPESLASLYRGVINLQARYILESPFCNSFQAPSEAGLDRRYNMGSDQVKPSYEPEHVWECKYELDSLAAFLEISTNYFEQTGDHEFFAKYKWVETVKMIMDTADSMKIGTRGKDGRILDQPYTFTRASRWGDTLLNGGKGSPVSGRTGLVRSAFRPSDDACIYQLFIPANMMYSRYLKSAAAIAKKIGKDNLHDRMITESESLREAIEEWGTFEDKEYGRVYAYEIDGFGSMNVMDDANIPSLLSSPFFGYLNVSDETYQNTRKKILSEESAYYSRGPVLNAVGGPHDGPGKAWPMARIVGILTTSNDDEIEEALGELVSSTAGLGLIHESINTFDQNKWTRQWFSWANGLFGQMILDLEKRKPDMLKKCFQPECLKKKPPGFQI